MLPSTQIFKTIDCPFFDETNDNCHRPYCHFRHIVKGMYLKWIRRLSYYDIHCNSNNDAPYHNLEDITL